MGYGARLGSWLAGDFNGDGGSDLLHRWGPNAANVWLSRRDGRFDVQAFPAWPEYGMSAGTWHAADIDGDGSTDLLHAWGGSSVNVWFGTRNGSFTLSSFTPWPGYGVHLGSWIAADVSGDGKAEFLHRWGPHGANMWIYSGGGTFTVRAVSPWDSYGMSGRWIPLDINGDRQSELVHLCCANYLNVWQFNSNASLVSVKLAQAWPSYGMTLGFWQPGDYNGDRRGDLLHVWGENANVWHSAGDGTFSIVPFSP